MGDRRKSRRPSARTRAHPARTADPVRRRLAEALARERATRAVLQLVATSRASAAPVFEAILDHALRLCVSPVGLLFLYDGDGFRLVADRGLPAAFTEPRRAGFRPGPHTGLARAVAERRPVHIVDVTADRAYAERDPTRVQTVEVLGVRTALWVPLLRDGIPVGAFALWRQKVRGFSREQIDLLATFAAQAVVALENTRLFQALETRNRELTEALEQQTATSEILDVISRSPTDLQPVFDAIAERAVRLCGALFGSVYRFDGELVHMVADFNYPPEALEASRRWFPAPPGRGLFTARAILDRAVVHVPDVEADPEHRATEVVRAIGFLSALSVPMLRDGAPIGAITVWRAAAGPFAAKQIALLQTFAAQAVIAIENVRLFQELQARNRELTEALEQQTATSEILRVISSSPTDLQPVLDAIVTTAARLCDAHNGAIFRFDGEAFRLAAAYNVSPAFQARLETDPVRPGRGTPLRRAGLERRPAFVADVLADPELGPARAFYEAEGLRTALAVPMLKEDALVGAITIHRPEVRPFTDKQIALVTTFASQAVIAIENVRLFQELEARNRELTEALEQQTATAEVLRVISASPTDTQPVFDMIVERAVRLCDGPYGAVFLSDGERIRLVARHGATAEALAVSERVYPRPLGRDSIIGQAILDRAVKNVADVEELNLGTKSMGRAWGFRSQLTVPMLHEGNPIGGISVTRREVGRFSDKQVALLRTFADQAVIAIQNVRLFRELRTRTDELARSVEELRALGEVSQAVSSTLDLETVLTTIAARADQLSGTDGSAIYEYDEASETFRLRASVKIEEELIGVLRATPTALGEGVVGRAGIAREPVQIPDILGDDAYRGRLREIAERAGYRALLAVPLLREDRLVGALVVRRRVPGSFPAETVNLLQTFAAQSVLAIQNARLFRELEDKSRQLEVASRHKSQFLANMSHELRTPLNAILGYTELIQDQIYGEVPAKIREVMERVDKSGRHLLGLINDVLDLSKIEAGQLVLTLNDYSMKEVVQTVVTGVESLAAEKKLALKITVAPDLPRGRGDERRLTQVLLNLVGNAIKFTEAGEVRVDVRAANGTFVVAVADTGPGIAPADQPRIFEEFQQADTSATRKKGGTGLGLSIARRIVELHGGRLDVESAPGHGSTFTVIVPVRVERQAATP